LKATTRARLPTASVLLALLVLAAFVSFRVRFRAWPEILVPSYLCGRGWLLYRDIKIVHSPLSIGALAAIFRISGFSAGTLRACAFLPFAAVLFELRQYGRERRWPLGAQASAGLFFVATFFAWDGNAIYPEIFLAVLVIPIYTALRRGGDSDLRRAGWLLGAALMIKQPSLFAVLFAATWVRVFHRRAGISFLARVAALPVACFLFFAAMGAGRDFVRWTLAVPFLYYRGRTSLPIQPSQTGVVLSGVLPLLAAGILAAARPARRRETLLLVGLIVAFALLAFPHFELVHLLAAVPLLALAAGEAAAGLPPHPALSLEGGAGEGVSRNREASLLPLAVSSLVAVSILLSVVYLVTDSSAGEMSFWSSKQDDAVVRRLSAMPKVPLFLYGLDQNLFVRSGRLPPGGMYSNPDLWFHYLVDGLESRQVHILRAHPETVVLEGLQTPIETPAKVLPRFLAAHYRAEAFTRDGARLLKPR
jgi:hypothetical protein